MNLKSNLDSVRQRINKASAKSGRQAQEVLLLAVSKTKPQELIREAWGLGLRDFGENYVQEACGKIDSLSDLPISWHFVGQMQSNKAKVIARNFHWVHTVASLKSAKRLSNYAQHELNICIQINISDEAAKAGVASGKALDLALAINDLTNLNLRGLMAIPKVSGSYDEQVQELQKMTELLNYLNHNGLEMDTLSMGMSGDLEAAIAAGATIVRVGSDIFGKR
jgi:PLP dependent protein